MNRVVRGVLVPLSMVAVLAGCAMDPTSPTSTTSHTASTTVKLRPVTIPYRDGLVYTLPETSAKALCHALSLQEWHSLLGTEAARTIEIDHGFSCVVASGSRTISMSMVSTEPSAPPRDRETERIGGYPAWTEHHEAVIDLVDGPDTTWAKPYLHVTVAAEPGDYDQRDLLRRLVTTLLTKLTHDGPATPGDTRRQRRRRTHVRPDPTGARRSAVRPAAAGPGTRALHRDDADRGTERHLRHYGQRVHCERQ
jgi:hypothetical protein